MVKEQLKTKFKWTLLVNGIIAIGFFIFNLYLLINKEKPITYIIPYLIGALSIFLILSSISLILKLVAKNKLIWKILSLIGLVLIFSAIFGYAYGAYTINTLNCTDPLCGIAFIILTLYGLIFFSIGSIINSIILWRK